MMFGGFDLEERLVAEYRAARDEQLGEDRDRSASVFGASFETIAPASP
jgi:hypothetical protein